MSQAPDITGVEGERLDATVTVDSTFSSQETQTIELRVEDFNSGTVVHTDSQQVTLQDSTDSQQITLSWAVPSGQTEQDYTATVSSADDSVSQTVTVSSVSTLPGSARNRWKIGANSGSTLNDSVGTADGTINGATRVSDSNAQNGEILRHNGSSDYTELTKLGSFGSNLTTDFAIGITVQTTVTPSGGVTIGAQSSSDGSGGTSGDATTIRNEVSDDSTVEFNLIDQDKDRIISETSSLDSAFSDGNKHRYVYNKTSNSASGLNIWQDASQQSMTITSDEDFNNTIDFDLNPVQLCRIQFNGGFDTNYLAADIDDVIIYSDSLSASEIQDDYDIQPWV